MAKMPSTSSTSFALDFLRRLLCAHTTAAPRDDAAPGYVPAPEELEPEGRSPCIVARLMGLDAMPPPAEPAHAQQPQKQVLRRSRSASSVESPSGVGDAAADKPAAAVVRPSASLREKPAYLRAENDMFLLLSFSPEEHRDAANKADYDDDRRRENRPGRGGGVTKQRRPHRRKLQFGEDDEEELGRRRGECCSATQSSSPVSVLEVHEDSSTTTTTTASSSLEDVDTHSEDAHLFASEQQSSSSSAKRKPHCTIQLDDDDEVSPATTSTVVRASAGCRSDGERRGNSSRRTAVANRSDASTSTDVSGVWQPVCRLVEEDLLKSTEWLPTRRRHGACASDAGLVVEVGSEILEQLVCEATDELVGMCCEVVCALPLIASSPMHENGAAGSRKHSSGRARIAAGY